MEPPQFKITVNERELHFPAGISLLMALKEHHIYIPSACGGRGACGLCKVRITRGSPASLSPREQFHLTQDERQNGFRLACQVLTNQAMALTIPGEYLQAKEFTAEVEAIRDLTHDIRELQMRLLDPPVIDFKAGQYIELQIPRYEQVQRLSFRAYSIASPPSASGRIELEIRKVSEGLGSTYIFKHLKLHDRVRFHGPHGRFYLRESPHPMILIAGGSGMAPIKSILYDMHDKHISRATRYFFGARNRRDLFLVDEMQRLEADLPDFKFIPALSEPRADDSWEGETGLITDVVERHIIPGQSADAYLCGSPGMINACLAMLTRKGFDKGHIYYDKFA